VVTQRVISPGVLVSPGQVVLRVAQIEPIRLQANVPTADLERIQVGATVEVDEQAGGRAPIFSRVTSITPAIDPAARTGIVEAIVPNRDRRFLPGQYITMEISTGRAERALRVPNRAVHWRADPSGDVVTTDSTPFVWTAESAGQGMFTARQVEIKTGARGSEFTEVTSGLAERQAVIVTGAESLRNGDMVSAVNPPQQVAAVRRHAAGASFQEASVEITSAGFNPDQLVLKPGIPARITFTRKSEENCGTEVLMPDYGVNKPLPLNQPVVVELTPRVGQFKFSCGMDMLKGKLVVR
jgi:hypothetical protein